MRRNFNEWVRIRKNIVDPASDIINEIINPIGDIKNWWKTKQRDRLAKERDPRNQANMPHSYEDLINGVGEAGQNFQTLVGSFANNLGLKITSSSNPQLWRSLSNIAAARYYGSQMGAVELTDIAHVWQVISRGSKTNPGAPTRAQQLGVIRPLAIPMKVPGVTPQMRYDVTHDAQEYDAKVVNSMQQQNSPARERPSTDGTADMGPSANQSTSPFNLGKSHGPRSAAGRKVVGTLKSQIAALEALPNPTREDARQAKILQSMLDFYLGKQSAP